MVRIQSGRILREKYLITVFCGARRTDNNKLRLSILDLESLNLYMERFLIGGKVKRNLKCLKNLRQQE